MCRDNMLLFERDIGADFVSLAWSVDAERYGVAIEESDGEWRVMSDKLTGKSMIKRKLQPSTTYKFRAKCLPSEGGEWTKLGPVFSITTLSRDEADSRMATPTLVSSDNISVTIQWLSHPDATHYEVEMRNRRSEWTTVTRGVKGLAVRKKHLVKGEHYTFRVQGISREGLTEEDEPRIVSFFSETSKEFTVATVANGFTELFGPQLVSHQNNNINTVEALSSSAICLQYASASWCPPCQKFTPQLVQFYNMCKQNGRPIEIVYVSSDQDIASYTQYYGKMPWLSLPFGSPNIQKVSQHFQIKGIPNCKVFSTSTGKVLCDNAVQVPLTLATFDSWMKQI